jgi:cell wall-associated NlpC family hydrolase
MSTCRWCLGILAAGMLATACSSVPTPQVSVVQKARSLLGSPYCAGGSTTECFDCSGFVAFVVGAFGVPVPRTSQEISTRFPIRHGQLEVGDIVVFGASATAVNHVGIYSGNGMFFHASSSKGVMQSALADSFWKARYLGARAVTYPQR